MVGPGIWLENEGNVKKGDTQTVGPVIWRKNRQTRKMRISHGRTWNMVGNTEKREKR